MAKKAARKIEEKILDYLRNYPHLSENFYRQLLISLHTEKNVTVDQIYEAAHKQLKQEIERADEHNPNEGTARRWDQKEKIIMHSLIVRYASELFTEEEIDTIFAVARGRSEAQKLEDIASLPDVSFRLLADRLKEFCALTNNSENIPESEAMGIRVALIRHFISDQLEFIGVAKRYLKICDFLPIVENSIGPKRGIGKIGGKAAGMFLAYKILCRQREKSKEPGCPVAIPESYFLRSDLYLEFINRNGLIKFYDEKYKPIEEIRADFPMIKEVFKNGEFPENIVKKLRKLLKKWGKTPIIVRSSSLLEDNFGSAFSGKYDSIFLPNQDTLENRLQALLGAIAEVYASTLGPDPILYRRERNLIDYDEQMGILIQKVVGIQYRHYYLPIWAGVGFARNEYRWSKRIRKEDGLLRLVMGLGTRAVDRVGSDYPRMVALSIPSLRPEANIADIRKYSQRYIDVINLQTNRLETVTLDHMLSDEPFPFLDQIVSIEKDNDLQTPVGKILRPAGQRFVITFDKLLTQTHYPQILKKALKTLEKAYGYPVDIEFAFDGQSLFILQCRPQTRISEHHRPHIPENLPEEAILFTANHDVPNGVVRKIDTIVYIDPKKYDQIQSYHDKLTVGKIVGKLNVRLAHRKFILMGPGRWGSNDINLGVRVRYADISRTKMLIEIARQTGNYIPEVSFGTHFFQDLVEAKIYHLPLYPDEKNVRFNETFFQQAPNELAEIVPEYAQFADVVRVIDVPKATGGKTLTVALDGENEQAVAYFE